MKFIYKDKSCHSGSNGHKGHGWMMLLCVVLMIGTPLLVLSSSLESFSLSLLGTAVLPIVLCLIMHGVMMKFMMSNNKEEKKKDSKHSLRIETKLVEHRADTHNRFKA